MEIQIYIAIISVLIGGIISYLIKIRNLKVKINKVKEISLSLNKIKNEDYDEETLRNEWRILIEKMNELEKQNQIKIKSVDRDSLNIKFSTLEPATNTGPSPVDQRGGS